MKTLTQYTNKVNGGVYTVVTITKATGDVRAGGFGPIIVYKNDRGELFSRSLGNFKDYMSPIDLEGKE